MSSIFNDIHRHPEMKGIKNDGHVISTPVSSTSSSKSEQKGNWTVNSRVLSASVQEGKNRWTNVAAPISITFVNEIPVANDAGKKNDAGKFGIHQTELVKLHRDVVGEKK